MPSKKESLRILISNDDSIHAPGLKILEQVAKTITDDIWVVAPANEQSGAAHSLTLHRPLRARQLSEKRFSVDGTPTDCVVMALEELLEGKKPDLLLSGINNGVNVADDITYSGTVAAAMEGTSFGIPSIALSQANVPTQPIKWQTALDHAPGIIKKLIKIGWPKNVLININFPDVISKSIEGAEIVPHGTRPPYKSIIKSVDPRGNNYYWIGPVPERLDVDKKSDLTSLMEKKISITPLHLDLNHTKTLNHLEKNFK